MLSRIVPIAGAFDRVPLAETVPLKSPLSLYVFPSNACNFRCTYCAHSMKKDALYEVYGIENDFMSVDTMRKIVEQSKAFGPYKVMLFVSQGEPLLNKQLPQMIKLASDNNLAGRYEIISNGSLLTKEYSDALIDSGLTNLRVSLQGLDSENYRETCGVAVDVEKLRGELEYFYQHKRAGMGLFVKVMDVALPDGGEEWFYKMFDNICDRMYVEHVQPVYHAVNVPRSAALSDRYGNKHAPRFVCPFPFYQLCVWPGGDVHPCDAIYRPVTLGNVHTSTLEQMWNGGILREFRLNQLRGGYNTLPKCENCCAPNDCSNEMDVLDGKREVLISKMEESL